MNILSENNNTLLKRKEISFSAEQDGNPGFRHVIEKVAEKFGVDAEVIAVKELAGAFGTSQYTAKVFIYETPEQKKAIEPKVRTKAKKEGAA